MVQYECPKCLGNGELGSRYDMCECQKCDGNGYILITEEEADEREKQI